VSYDLEFERDSALRHWKLYAPKHDIWEYGFEFRELDGGSYCLELTDNLIRELYNKLPVRR